MKEWVDKMDYFFMVLFKLTIFFISNLGIWEYFRRKSRVNIYFLPAFTISLQVTILFCAGILNCLELAALLMFGAGILFAIYYLCTDFKNVVHAYWNIGYLFLAVSLCILLTACRGRMFVWYDNFSHWALVVKNMLLTNRFPSFQDTKIIFQEYPLGSASYIYYFAKMVSGSESIQMVAQGFMMLSFILPVFKCVKRNMVVAGVYVLFFVNFIFCYNIAISDLLVDTLLPLQGMAMLFFIYSECLGLPDKNNGEGGICPLYAIPFLSTALQIKNSGIYFVAIACILFGFSMWCDRHGKKPDKKMKLYKIVTMAAPFVSLYLWHAHCNYIFSAGSTTKHAMTLQNYKNVYSNKSEDDIANIIENVFQFFLSGKQLYILLLFIVIIGILSFFLGVKMRNQYLRLVLVCTIIYMVYIVGTAGMYLFSMPGGEATGLSGIGRYRNTIFVAIYYLFLLFSMLVISSVKEMKRSWFYLAGIYAALFIVWGREGGKSFPTIFEYTPDETRAWLEQVVEEYEVPSGASYLICVSEAGEGDFLWHLCHYGLWSDNVLWLSVTEKSQLDENAGNFKYILVKDGDNPYIQEWIEEKYPKQKGKSVIVL